MPVVKDLNGQIFGRLKVTTEYKFIKRPDGRGNRTKWLCKCTCGNKKWVLRDLLINGHTQSCGCINKDKKIANYGKARKNDLYATYKYNASIRNLEFSLTREEFYYLTQENCFYCDRSPSQILKSRTDNGDHVYSGVDRIDNSHGYTTHNSVSCCKHCNYAKGKLAAAEFLSHIEQIFEFRVKHDT
jgi:hypothetical protein